MAERCGLRAGLSSSFSDTLKSACFRAWCIAVSVFMWSKVSGREPGVLSKHSRRCLALWPCPCGKQPTSPCCVSTCVKLAGQAEITGVAIEALATGSVSGT